MAKMEVKRLEALRPGAKPYKRAVDKGLLVRVAPSGLKTFIVTYIADGVRRDYPLSRPWGRETDPAHISLADARAESERIRALARQGIDYKIMEVQDRQDALERRAIDELAKQAQRANNLTVADLFKAWIEDGVARKDGNAELKRSFAADVLPVIGAVPVKELTEHQLRALFRKMVDRGVNRAAVMVRNSLTQMFAWAEKRQPWRKLLVDGDPMDLIEIEKIVSPEYNLSNVRSRWLSDDEIRELRDVIVRMRADYDSAPDRRSTNQPLDRITECGIWIMLSTLARVGEMSMSKWEHVDLVAEQWFIPKENVKDNVGDLTVYLSPFALAQFSKLKALTGHTDWCFPGRGAESHMDVKSITKQLGDRQCMFKKAKDGTARKPMKNRRHDNTLVLAGGKTGAWTPHDLRRTGATLMQRLGVSMEMIDRCQNHVLPGSKVRRHYLHHDYADEKRAAWEALGQHISKLLG